MIRSFIADLTGVLCLFAIAYLLWVYGYALGL